VSSAHPVERSTRALVRRALSRRASMRGAVHRDGRCTLLVVDWRSTDDVVRLVRSFRRFVSGSWPVVVVQNDSLRRRPFRGLAATLVGPGVNLHHGLGLDWGLRFVSTEYVLICDPDSVVCSADFWFRVRALVDTCGVASIDNGAAQFHPICLAMPTELWKRNAVSMEEDWSRGYDVGGAITELVGFTEEALLQRSRSAGPAMPSRRPGCSHFIGEVYEDLFSNTYGVSRLVEQGGGILDGWSRSETEDYHAEWRRWADALVAGEQTVDQFPTSRGPVPPPA
jgi:hypothetical protein